MNPEAERHLRLIADHVTDVFWVLDLDAGRFTYVSQAVTQLRGFTPEEVIAQPVDAALTPASAALVGRLVAERLAAGEPEAGRAYVDEVEQVRRDGTTVWTETTTRFARNPESGHLEVYGTSRDVTARRRAEEAARASERQMRVALDAAQLGTWHNDLGAGRLRFDERARRHFDLDVAEATMEDVVTRVHPEDRERLVDEIRRALDPRAERVPSTQYRVLHRSGAERTLSVQVHVDFEGEGDGRQAVVAYGTTQDVTERLLIEERLRESQKLEAIGRLAGGIAHDFNNLLTVISGGCELLGQRVPRAGVEAELLADIRDASQRAASLTRQLLAFSRSQVLSARVVDLDEVVTRLDGLLRRVIGEDVAFQCVLAPDAGRVRIDPSQLEQVVLNLVVNARDAMPHGGRLTIETRRVDLAAPGAVAVGDLAPGAYAVLSVHDTGTGMSPEVRSRVFEPFFSTKGPGRGSGLGLATVFGIVTQSGGHVAVRSRPGAGSTFDVYLPRVDDAIEEERPGEVAAPSGRGETILLVEDEAGVRAFAQRALEQAGYRVVVAEYAEAALGVADRMAQPADLLLTDLVMPGGLNGVALAARLEARWPGLRVLLMSGYVEDEFDRHGLAAAGRALLHKPFSLADLACRVRALLDGRP